MYEWVDDVLSSKKKWHAIFDLDNLGEKHMRIRKLIWSENLPMSICHKGPTEQVFIPFAKLLVSFYIKLGVDCVTHH